VRAPLQFASKPKPSLLEQLRAPARFWLNFEQLNKKWNRNFLPN
jgi:hypothetical protein